MADNQNLPVPNINLDEEWKEASEGQKRESNFNEKNYLNVRLNDDENEKELVIRLLPMDPNGGSPFVHVHFHNVEVNKELVKPGQKPYKSFVCLNPRNNPTIDHEKFGNKCPFCEVNKDAYEKSTKATTETEKKEWQDLSIANKTKEAIIVRCIERGKEDEGVKFWKFNLKYDKSDPYNKILNIARKRAEEGKKAGIDINILDLYKGRDLNITVKRGNTENQTVIEVVEAGIDTPVTPDREQLVKWLNDEKKWQDVFTAKPYDYLQIIQDGKIPWYDKEEGKWVDKDEYDMKHGEKKKEQQEKVAEADKTVENSINKLKTSSQATSENQVIEDIPSGDNDEELPF